MFDLFRVLLITVLCLTSNAQALNRSNENSEESTELGVFTGAEGIKGWQLISWQGDVSSKTTDKAIADYKSRDKTNAELKAFKSEIEKYKYTIETRLVEWGGFSIQKANNKKLFDHYRFSVFVPQEETCDFSFKILIKSKDDVLTNNYRVPKRGEWNTFEYSAKNPFTPTQLEFQKTDMAVCNAYFTDLILDKRNADDSNDLSSQSEDGATAQIVSVLVIILSLCSIFAF